MCFFPIDIGYIWWPLDFYRLHTRRICFVRIEIYQMNLTFEHKQSIWSFAWYYLACKSADETWRMEFCPSTSHSKKFLFVARNSLQRYKYDSQKRQYILGNTVIARIRKYSTYDGVLRLLKCWINSSIHIYFLLQNI